MTRASSGAAAHDLETLLRSGSLGGLSDPQLLERFLAVNGPEAEDAFASLVERHGPMVLAVCRRILRHPDDAEDAFQATFLVLARKARSIGRRELLANWLYGVAVRTAREQSVVRARRLTREGQVSAMTRDENASDEDLDELRAALDVELSRLSDAFRGPVVLCDLEGKTHVEAARILGLPVGTVSSRLVRAREKLRKRLVRRGLGFSAGAVAAVFTSDAATAAVPPGLVAATARAAVEYVSVGAAAAIVPPTLASLAENVSKSLFVGKLTAAGSVLTMSLVLAATIGAAAVATARFAFPEQPGPFERTVNDDWSWVDRLSNADAATRDRLKRCARSALENYAALHRLSYDFDLVREQFFNDGKNHFKFKAYPYKGRLYWNEGAVRYDFEGELPQQIDKEGNPVPRPPGTYSTLRTRELFAKIQDHDAYGVVLQVDPPPKDRDAWRNGHDLDPWIYYASCFRPEPMTLKEFWGNQKSIESREDASTINFSMSFSRNTGWMEITCGKSVDSLPLNCKYGTVQNAKKMTWGEETCEWTKTDGVWYPRHYVKTAFIGAEMRPTKEVDLRVTNLHANTGAKIPAAVFTLSDLPFPDGYGGWDTRKQPWGSLIRSNGVVRERRMGEPWKDSSAGPVPYPRLAESVTRVPKADYLALAAEYAAKRRGADEAMMKARTESEQKAAMENLAHVQSAYARRFLALAEKHAGDPVAVDALIHVATNEFTPGDSEQAADLLIRDHVAHEELRSLYAELGSPHLVHSQAGEKLLRAGLASAPTHSAQGAACCRLAEHLKYKARELRKLMEPHPDAWRLLFARACGGTAPHDARPGLPESLESEAVQLYTRLAEQYGDISVHNEPAVEIARNEIFKLRELARGKPAPQIDAPDVDARPMKLSDYRGKVVVLVFTMSDSHDAKYGIERGLVQRMKNRPLAVLSVSYDFEKETLKRAIQEGLVTWPCWWEGPESGPIHRGWRVNEIPSVFVIDAQGIIRAKEVEGEALDSIVEHLVQEAERAAQHKG